MITDMKLGWLVLLLLLLATSSAHARAANAGPIPPSITISDAVGTNPGIVYTAAQTQRTVNVDWNAGSDYPYCEIYFTVNNANQTELGRGHDGAKPVTVKAGSTYAFWMIVYLGAQGQDVRTVANFTVVGLSGNPPTPPPSGGGGGGGGSANGGFSEAAKSKSSVLKEILNAPFISDVQVQPDSRNVVISFASTQSTPPLIEIGRVAPAPDRFGIMAFPFNSGTFTRFATEQKGRYTLDVDVQGEQLDIGTPYYYIINVFNNNRNDTKRPREQITGQFNTLPQTVKVVWERILMVDDSDELSTGECHFWFWANYGHPSAQDSNYVNRDMDSGHNYYFNRTVVINNAPDRLKLEASGLDWDGTELYITENPPLNGPEDKRGAWEDVNAAKDEFDLSLFPGNSRTVKFRLATTGGSLRFVVFGHFEITRGEQIGTTSSALQTGPAPEPIKAQGRVRLPGTSSTTNLTICEAARLARERNSPAAPGLEEKCRAQQAIKAQGRVKLPEGTPPNPPIPICESARLARARNSPAAPGLEQKCLAAKGEAIANADPVVAAARNAEADASYRQGFDIATAIFGDPALGAQGNTQTGPGSLGIRNSLNAAGQRGFNASVKLHLSRKYDR